MMTMKRSNTVRTQARIAGTAFTLLASLALAGPASAAKGGKPGGKPGGDEDPPPFYYVVNWIGDETEGNNRNYYRLNDVTSDGTVVGQFWPLRDYGERHAVVVFPDGEMVDIEALLLAEGVVVPGTRVTTAFGVTEDLLMGVDLWDPSGQFMTGALQLDASRGIASFAVFAGSGRARRVCDRCDGERGFPSGGLGPAGPSRARTVGFLSGAPRRCSAGIRWPGRRSRTSVRSRADQGWRVGSKAS